MESKKLYRSSENKVFAGVCGGIGEYIGIDPVLVRLVWVIGVFFSFGAGVLGYIIAYAIIPGRDSSGAVRRHYGCLYVLMIIVLAMVAISVVSAVFGFFGASFLSGTRVLYNLWESLPFNGISLVALVFMFISGLIGVTLIVLIIFLIKAIAGKDNRNDN